jgi:hypothetical protein
LPPLSFSKFSFFLKPSRLSLKKKFNFDSQINQRLYIELFFPSHVRFHYSSFNASYKANKRREEKNKVKEHIEKIGKKRKKKKESRQTKRRRKE